jgi:hypothetical protein
MKQFIYLLAFAFMSVNATSQTIDLVKDAVSIGDLKVSQTGNNLQITWSSNIKDDNSYWEVQASADGKEFKAIGIVFGSDPKSVGQYAFKQAASRIKPGYHYYRVARLEQNNSALASDAIRFTK